MAYNNPVTGDGRETDAQGKLVGASYVDPDGMDVGETDPASAPSDSGPPPMPMAGAYGSLFPGSTGAGGTSCIVDGIEMGCGFAGVLMDIGAAGQCPDNNCNPRMTKYGLRPLYLTDEGFGFWVRSQLRTAPTLKGPGQARPAQGSGPGPIDDGTNEGRRPSQVTLSGVNFMDPQNTGQRPTTPPCPPDFLGIIAGGQAVTNAFNEAFNNAHKTQVEHGGWVVMNRKGSLKSVLKGREGGDHRTAVQLGYPERNMRLRAGEVIVATFHAHVDDFGPDEGLGGDVDINTNRDRVPGIIIRESQVQAYGPKRGLWRRDLPSGCQ